MEDVLTVLIGLLREVTGEDEAELEALAAEFEGDYAT